MKRKQFYSVVCKGKIVGVAEQSGFEIKIDGEIFNAYRNEYKDKAYIIDPQTGLAVCTYEYKYGENGMPTEIEMIKRAKNKLMTEYKEGFEKWRAEERSKESYKLTVEMFATYIKAEELREKQKEAVLRESNEKEVVANDH
ncbi:MAG: hypothetical protein K2I07_15355 [Lachnospiraceae bacterium]|nr:hypothetical protein [Lachnospiraceae bacterium]